MARVEKLKSTFDSGALFPAERRIENLSALEMGIKKYENAICQAIFEDLGKPPMEAFFEISPLLHEIKFMKKHLRSWMAPKKAKTPFFLQPGNTWIESRPQGVVLILGAWNYPLILSLGPLVNAIAAGNAALIKPSELAPATSKLVKKLINEVLPPESFEVLEGGADLVQELFKEKWDHIFYTGGERVGRIIFERAAQDFTPFTLELGGKSPFVIDESVDLKRSARRLAFAKLMSAGQTCIAPDYLLVKESIRDEFLSLLSREIREQIPGEILDDPSYPRIINQRHFDRLVTLLDDQKILFGGNSAPEKLKIEPTLIEVPTDAKENALMKEEIFGPLLPVLRWETEEELGSLLKTYSPTPLAAYVFSTKKDLIERVRRSIIPGGLVINEVMSQLANPEFPFGGIRTSGVGRYHGRSGFDRFSHQVSVFRGSLSVDFPLRYRPYSEKKLSWLKRLIG